MAHAKANSRDLGKPQHIQTLGSSCSARCCNLGLRIFRKEQDAFQVLLLPHVYLPSAKQAGSSQHQLPINSNLSKYQDPLCQGTRETSSCLQHLTKAPTLFSLISTSLSPLAGALCGDTAPCASGVTAWPSPAFSIQPRVARALWISGFYHSFLSRSA